MCWAAKSTITGPIRGAASTSIGPTAIASISPTAPISLPPKKRCGRNGASARRRNSSVTAAYNSFPSPLWGGAGVGVARLLTVVDASVSPPDPHPIPPHKGEGGESLGAQHHAQAENHRLVRGADHAVQQGRVGGFRRLQEPAFLPGGTRHQGGADHGLDRRDLHALA